MGELLQIALAAIITWLLWAYFRRGSKRQAHDTPDRDDKPYEAYTTDFDRELKASDVEAALALSGARLALPSGTRVPNLPTRTEIADEAFDRALHSEGATITASALTNKADKISIAILIDQSGSMVNRAPQLVGQLRALEHFLSSAGHELALFGFTTMGWHGGIVREAWQKAGRPRYPGRLCALLHIVYKTFDQSMPAQAWQAMLNPRLFFENVDGEALDWAYRQLLTRSSVNKFLVVISDGAPVDDSTIAENGPNFLLRHLRKVIEHVSSDQRIGLGAIGIGYAVNEFYPISTQVNDENQFLEEFAKLLIRLEV